ncbi:Retrovirus-related Pol polyprotein from transposon [Trichinella sp. T9]|nr:Retrovirus-related Pol polyprotein from transposon [Trichinella sp. T9]
MEILIHLLGRHYRFQKNRRGTSLTLAGSTGEGKEHWPYIEPAEMSSHVKEQSGIATDLEKTRVNFAAIAHPLRQLLHKSHRWNWTQECESAFTELKRKLTTAPVLAFPRFDIPFILDVDVSGEVFDAVLTQLSGEEEHPVAYASRSLTELE